MNNESTNIEGSWKPQEDAVALLGIQQVEALHDTIETECKNLFGYARIRPDTVRVEHRPVPVGSTFTFDRDRAKAPNWQITAKHVSGRQLVLYRNRFDSDFVDAQEVCVTIRDNLESVFLTSDIAQSDVDLGHNLNTYLSELTQEHEFRTGHRDPTGILDGFRRWYTGEDGNDHQTRLMGQRLSQKIHIAPSVDYDDDDDWTALLQRIARKHGVLASSFHSQNMKVDAYQDNNISKKEWRQQVANQRKEIERLRKKGFILLYQDIEDPFTLHYFYPSEPMFDQPKKTVETLLWPSKKRPKHVEWFDQEEHDMNDLERYDIFQIALQRRGNYLRFHDNAMRDELEQAGQSLEDNASRKAVLFVRWKSHRDVSLEILQEQTY